MDSSLSAVLDRAERDFSDTVARLSALVRVPSCSFPGFDPAQVALSAEATAGWLREAGLPEVEVLAPGGMPPVVVGADRRAGASRPTLLLYAHHDVQPPMREALWRSPPFEPTLWDGRLYGRGAADDKAGIAVHAGALSAWYREQGHLPCNVVVLVEGEEETGSDHLSGFLESHLERLRADAVVIADLANHDTGLPSLTTSLRGMVSLELELRALERPVHSGVWGGVAPDCVLALCRMVASLAEPDGTLAVPGLLDGLQPPTPGERADWERLPWDPALFARQAGMDPAALGNGPATWERLWRQPALTVNAIQAGERGRTGNVLMDAAWTRLGVRIPPGLEPRRTLDLLLSHLRTRVPAGMSLTVLEESLAPAWGTSVDHPFFEAARRALGRGYGREPVFVGCGASIPFVGEMTARLGGVPALLVGVEDPWCNAHSENESVHLGDLLSAVRAEAALFAEISA